MSRAKVDTGGGRPPPPAPVVAPGPDHAVVAAQVRTALTTRAARLPIELASAHPDAAAHLLFSSVPTYKIKQLATAYQEAATYVNSAMSLAGVPAALEPYYRQAFAAPDPAAKSQALSFLDQLKDLPESAQQFMLAHLNNGGPIDASVLAQAGVTFGKADESGLPAVTHAIGTAFSAPFVGAGWLLSKGTGDVQAGLETLPGGTTVSQGLESIKGYVGGRAQEAGAAGMYAVGAATGVAAGVAAGAFGFPMGTDDQTIAEKFGRYVPSWSEFQAGEHTGVTTFLFDIGAQDVNAPENQGVADFTDMATYVVGGEVIARGLATFKATRTVPAEVVSEGQMGLLKYKAASEYVTSRAGRAVVKEAVRTLVRYPDEPVGALYTRFRNIEPDLARKLAATDRSVGEVSRVFEDHIANPPSAAKLAALETKRVGLQASIDEAIAAGDTQAARVFRTEELATRQQILDLARQQPQWEFPIYSRMRAVLYDTPVTRVEKILNSVYGPVRRRVKATDVRRVTDQLSEGKIWDQFDPSAPTNFLAENADYFTKQMNVIRVPVKTQRIVLEEMANLTTSGDYYKWMVGTVRDAFEEGLTRGGKRPLTEQQRQLLQFTDRSESEKIMAPVWVDAVDEFGGTVPVRRNVLERASNGAPMPARPTQFARSFDRPNIQYMHEAASTIRSWDRRIRSVPVLGKLWGVGHVPFDVAHLIALKLPRQFQYPLLLSTRVIPILQKLTGEQSFRNIGNGLHAIAPYRRLATKYDILPGGSPVLKGGIAELLPKTPRGTPDYSLIGTVLDEAKLGGEPIRYFEPTRGLDVNLSPDLADRIAGGTYDHLAGLHADPLTRMLAQRGPEATLRYLEVRTDTKLGYWYEHDMKPNLLDSKTPDPLTWLKLQDREIDQFSGGMPSIREYVATGRWKPPGEAGVLGEGSVSIERTARVQESLDITDAIAQARRDGNTTLENELAIRRDEIEVRIERLDAEHPQAAISSADASAFADELLSRYAAEEYQFPPEVPVTSYGVGPAAKTAREALDKVATKASRTLYAPLRLLARGDILATRGSSYFQLLERTYNALIENGWEKQRAYETAQYRAAFVTKDIMYDISARTSAQRFVKNLFWFAPVIQEQLVTWLIKIPNRSYWPLGFPIRAGQATALWRGFNELGWIQTDEQGNPYMGLPGLSTFIEKSTGLRVPELLSFDPTNLNILGQGGPTLAPGATALLNMATDHAPESLKPLLQTLSDAVTWDGPNGLLPTGVNQFLTLMGLDPSSWEFLSTDEQKMIERRAKDQAFQFAISDLADEGISLPMRADFADEATYNKARDSYIAQVQSQSASYEKGVQVVRLIGGILFPTSLHATTPAKEAWYKWKAAQDITFPYTQEDFDKINAYIDAHPEALPFSIGYSIYGPDEHPMSKDAPFTDTLTGVLAPAQYLIKQQAISGLRYEEGRLRGELAAAKLGSVSKQLYNRAAYKAIYDAHLIRMDDWLKANPDIERWLRSKEVTDFTSQQETVLAVSRGLEELASVGFFDGPGGIEIKDLGVVKGILGEASSKYDFGPPGTLAAKQKEWYYTNVLGPYYDQTDPLYKQAEILGEGSEDAGPIYDQILAINESYDKKYFYPVSYGRGGIPTYGTQQFPAPEEYSWGAKSEKKQRIDVLKWTTRPPTWLTQFQLGKVGYQDFQGRDDLLATIAKLDDQYYKAKANVSGNSAEADRLFNLRTTVMNQAAQPYGADGKQLVKLYLGPPLARLAATGFGQDNLRFTQLQAAAEMVAQRIQAQGYSMRGYSQFAIAQKAWLENIIETLRDRKDEFYNQGFDRLWSQLELAVPAKGYDRRRFVPLYEAILFGQFDPAAFGIDDLIKAVQ